MADLSRVKPSKNFEDRTPGTPMDGVHDMLNRIFWHLIPGFASAQRANGRVSPEENDEYVRRRDNMTKADPTDYLKKTVSDWTPEEWDLIRKNGFGFQDIQVIKEFRKARDKSRFYVEEDGSISRK